MLGISIFKKIFNRALSHSAIGVHPKLTKVLPQIDTDVWWGKGKPSTDPDTSVKDFILNVKPSELEDLKTRINADLARLTPPLEDVGFQYGFNTSFLAEVGVYWRDQYDWKKHEGWLNSVPQFTTNINGLSIHYIHVKPTVKAGQTLVPLLLVHGWPGSVVEFLDLIPLLTTSINGLGSNDIVFEIVAPSLPGYGFSSGPTKPGLNAFETAKIFRTLMNRLGHEKFYCQGGDWGSFITTNLATVFPQSVMGLHINFTGNFQTTGTIIRQVLSLFPFLHRFLVDEEDLPKLDPSRWSKLMRETGYLHLHATKPDTIGVALSSSPLGLAAYILEKFSVWTNEKWLNLPDGGLGHLNPIGLDKLLTNVMFYWISNSITSSIRFYADNSFTDPLLNSLGQIPVQIPTGVADFPHEISRSPRTFIRGKFPNLVQFSRMSQGGHFAAMEVPELLAEDIKKFALQVEKMEKYLSKDNKAFK